ncbi:MAG: 50S ribosomal protein L11 methyltransferase [Deltaproteobacteria bacterium]|nr:50S ribosomal protein L11 methyltransferase [Deltaproteobacteria bacterium]
MKMRKMRQHPYDMLYIYEIVGRAAGLEGRFGPGYLGCWQEADYAFLFFESPSREPVEDFVRKHTGLSYRSETVMPYQDWEAGDKIRTYRTGPLRIRPPWESGGFFPEEGDIIIDPGVVFGSGLHPSTRLCLDAIIRLSGNEGFETVLDLGCGTGILSLAAARLGAKSVLAVDNNNLAVQTVRHNVRHNGLDNVVTVVNGEALDFLNRRVCLLLANLPMEGLETLASQKEFFHIARWYVLAGMVGSQVHHIRQKLEEPGTLEIISSEHIDFWFSITASSIMPLRENEISGLNE